MARGVAAWRLFQRCGYHAGVGLRPTAGGAARLGGCMAHQPKLIVAAQPTRGVDVGAIEFIHQKIMDARDNGASILLVSSELDEILNLSDRLIVMFEGHVVASFLRKDFDKTTVGIFMSGGQL